MMKKNMIYQLVEKLIKMNKTAMVNGAIFIGIRNAMMEEQYKIPMNSGFCEELAKVNK